MSISTNYTQAPVQPVSIPQKAAATNPAATSEQTNSDLFQTNKTRPRSDVDMNTINHMISQKEQQIESFRQLVERLLGQQGATWVNAQGETMVEIDAETRANAQKDIEEGGYFSVEAVSQRLLDFARAFAGDDPERIELMRTAVTKGFAVAEEQWGGKLPQISQDTLAAVMAGFDEWLAGIDVQ